MRCKVCKSKMRKGALGGYAVWFCTANFFTCPVKYPTQKQLDEWFAKHKLWGENVE